MHREKHLKILIFMKKIEFMAFFWEVGSVINPFPFFLLRAYAPLGPALGYVP